MSYEGPRVVHTQINMLEESHVKRFSNGISLVGVKNNLSAIVAFLQCGENIG